ncbi:MAG: hypothetical protein CVU84_12535 [Firmicutes bacterium HGW-Firmicutes-1]|jgi:outer membrane receptor for Fe3+-dicitrate|nr:MAG: hypothetical protein CVU84_12535 [Firmicutes bacterium HGW-Firmicutes-1]
MNQNFSNNNNQTGLNNTSATAGTSGAINASGVASNFSGTTGVNSNLNSSVTTGAVGAGVNTGTQNVQQIRQQVQTLQNQLRQTSTAGTNNQAYTDAANRLQDAYEILNKLQ